MSVKAILTGQTNTASSTEESSVAVYNVTLTTANWTENEDGYIQRVPIISVTTDDTCVVIATPADGDKAW